VESTVTDGALVIPIMLSTAALDGLPAIDDGPVCNQYGTLANIIEEATHQRTYMMPRTGTRIHGKTYPLNKRNIEDKHSFNDIVMKIACTYTLVYICMFFLLIKS
jgi:TRAP-type uncharacterized transport system fused permease subunit